MRNYKLYLHDILDAMESIEEFVGDMDFEDFKKDDRTSSAVVRKFEVMGEAVKNIPEGVKRAHPQIPWREMAGMRDKLIHFYFGVDYKLVWTTVKKRLPQLKPLIRKVLEEI